MCDTVICPAQIDPRSAQLARTISEQAIASLPGAGIFGVELFLLKDGNQFEIQIPQTIIQKSIINKN